MKKKKNVLLTGRPGVGKTTVVEKVVRGLSGVKTEGFYTEEIRGQKGIRTGFRIRTLDGISRVLSQVGLKSEVTVGKYGVDMNAIEAVINPVIETAMGNAELLVLDEIGKMETASPKFKKLVEQALSSAVPVLATVPSGALPFTDKLKKRRDVQLIEVTAGNRDALPAEILRQILLS